MKKIRYTLVLVLSLGLIFSYSITSENSASAANKISIVNYDNDKKIEKEAPKQLYVGESADYDVKFNDKYYDGKKGSISEIKTSNTKILNYKPNTTGEFNALSVGTAVLSATMSNVKTSLTVTVRQPVTSLKPKYLDITLTRGQSTQLDTEILPANATYKSQGLSYTSQNTNIVSVNQNGQVVANNQGHTKINISFENKNRYGSKTPKFVNAEVTINVVEQSPSSPSASQSTSYSLKVKNSLFQILNKGKTFNIDYQILPNIEPKPTVRFKSKNSKIAIVNNKGVIKAIKTGETTISIILESTVIKIHVKIQDLYGGGVKGSHITSKIDKYQFSFLNTLTDIQKSANGYTLNKKEREKLKKSLKKIKKNFKSKYTNQQIEAIINSAKLQKWVGLCFGISSVYALNYQKLLNFRKISNQNPPKKNAKWYLNKVQKPIKNSIVRSILNYFHILQFELAPKFYTISESNWISPNKTIVNNAKQKVLGLFIFQYRKDIRHAIVLGNKMKCPAPLNLKQICINVIDPNKEIDFLNISQDYKRMELVFLNRKSMFIHTYDYTTQIKDLFRIFM